VSAVIRGVRILIVEDEPVVAADLQTSLEGLGYQIVGVENAGADAVRSARQSRPDLVLMDIGLKGSMDGIAAAEAIHTNSNTPVVFLTGDSKEETMVRASSAGPYGYLLKPFRTKELNATILVALQQHRLGRELFTEQTWLRTMLQSLSDGVMATDAHGLVRYINPAGEALTGCSLAAALGKPIEEVYRLTTMENTPVDLCQLRIALRTRSPVAKRRFLMHSCEDRVLPIEDAASPVLVGGDVVGAVTVFFDISEQIRKERELEIERDRLAERIQLTTEALGNTRAELRALSGHLITAQEEERRRVARELHDDLSQRAALAAMELERIAPLLSGKSKNCQNALQIVRQQIAELSDGLRDVSHRLHPSVIEHLGLAEALSTLVNDYRRNGVDASFLARDVAADVPLSTGTTLYRIAQEALRNASKYAAGAPVRVTLEQISAELRLRIEDAGPGFDVNQVRAKGGLGLLNLQERARLVGGTLLLRTRPGDGTMILVRVPLL
jgi:PAS domain S-box-containing protein